MSERVSEHTQACTRVHMQNIEDIDVDVDVDADVDADVDVDLHTRIRLRIRMQTDRLDAYAYDSPECGVKTPDL